MALTKITSNAFAASAVDSDAVGANTITTAKIADNNVTHAKLHTTMDLSSKTVTLPTLNSTVNIDVADLFVKDTTGGAQGQVQIGAGTVQGFINIQKGDGTRNVQISSDADTYFNGGNVGIGTDNPGAPLEVHHASIPLVKIKATTSSGQAALYLDGYHDGGSTHRASRINFRKDTTTEWSIINDYTQNDSNTLDFEYAGSRKVTFTGDGKVGIGTDNPDGPLHVKSGSNVTLKLDATLADGSGSFTSMAFARNGTNKWRFFQYGDDSRLAVINDQAGNYEQISLASNGSVGIGDNSPQARLEVRNNTDATDTILATANLTTAGNYHNLLLGDGTAYAVGLRRHITVSNPSYLRPRLDFVVQDTDTYLPAGREVRMSITHNGKVGIGTTNPGTKLHVQSEGGGNSNGTFYLGIDTATNYPAMVIQTATGGNYSETHGLYIKNTAAGFGLRIDDAAGDTSPFVVDASGRVGIGTSSPTSSLEVLGPQTSYPTTRIIGTGSSDNPVLTVETNTDSRDPHIRLLRPTTTQGAALVIRGGAVNWLSIHHVTQGADSQLVVHNNGNVGVNVQTPGAKLHVVGDFLIGQQRFREGYVGISGSETRWFKLINYATGAMLIGRAYLTANRFGGYNQTGAYKEYKASISGFSNAIYGPLNTTGDTGEGGVMSLEIGTDEHLYLRVNTSIYGGTVYFYLQGYINNWQFDGSTYVTSAP